jgi:hypothetical protein
MPAIQTVQQLRALLGEPNPLVERKIHSKLNQQAVAFIARAPMLFLATAGADGAPTVSPKGDSPGFVRVVDEHTMLIPERKGNKLLFSLQHILSNPHIGLIFVVPGTSETLRIGGEAQLIDDSDLCASFAERGKPALLVVRVRITQCYFHCAKALLRAQLWDAQSWAEPLTVSFGREIAQAGAMRDDEIDNFDRAVQGRYRTDL